MSADAVEAIAPIGGAVQPSVDNSRAFFAARSIAPGCVATSLISVGALGLGWLPFQPTLPGQRVLDFMQSTMPGTIAASTALVAGVCMLVFAWLQLGQDLAREPGTDLRRLWLALAAWSAPLILTPPLFSRDVYAYFAQGKLLAGGFNPYTHGPSVFPDWLSGGVDPLWADSPSPYGQFFLMLARQITEISGPSAYVGTVFFRILAVVGVGLLAWAVPQLARAYGVNPARALWLGVLNPLVIMHLISGAHNDSLMVGLIAAGLALAVRRQPVVGVLLVTLAGAVKPIGLVALPFVGLIWAGAGAAMSVVWRRWAVTAVISVVTLLGMAALTGTGYGWLNAISTSSSVRTWLSPPTALAMAAGYIGDLAGIDATDTLIAVARGAAGVLAFGLVAYLCLSRKGRTPVRAAGLAFLVLVVLGPVVQPWYLLWSLPLLAAAALTKQESKILVFATVGLVFFSLASHFFDGAGYT